MNLHKSFSFDHPKVSKDRELKGLKEDLNFDSGKQLRILPIVESRKELYVFPLELSHFP